MTNKYYHIFLDDERQPKDVKWIELPLVQWTIVRNYYDFVKTISQLGVPATVTFDHDLADEHYASHTELNDPRLIGEKRIQYEKFKEKTGRDCAIWIVNYCIDKKLPLPIYYVHTLNYEGGQNIISIMESGKKAMNYGSQNS